MPTRGFEYRSGLLCCEDVSLEEISSRVGTPAYVYAARSIVENYRAYTRACGAVPHTIHYAVKANGSLGVLALLARHGAGFDIVSGGELFRVLQAGGDPARVVFPGVGKTADEIDYALGAGIAIFNCESEAELELIHERAKRRQMRAPITLRVNPDVSAETHPYIATGLREHKFGIPIGEAEDLYVRAARMENLEIRGVSCHIGSQILDINAFVEALSKILDLIDALRRRGIPIRHLDLGGGLGVGYRPEDETPEIGDYLQALLEKLEGRDLELHLEPGRSIVAQAGILLTTVLYRKQSASKEFIIVDAAMNDLIRPALYKSYHDIIPVRAAGREPVTADIVGPICETGDFFARDRRMPLVEAGELLAVCTAGAYGFALSSNYNARPRAPEVLVEGGSFTVIRDRETYADLIRGERTG
ncbi:MAG: diaminopimelate decarboxylase [Acidobacteria bacterium]|nr:diaminopimelate decarboxylase [Acidobacteriota bacterium]